MSPDGTRVYVANAADDTVSVIDTATNTVVGDAIPVGGQPEGVVVSPDGTRLYVTNYSGSVSVIDTATNTVVGNPIPVNVASYTVAITPDGTRLYVPDSRASGNTVSVIDTPTNSVIGNPISVGRVPFGVAVAPDGTRVYVANNEDGTVSVIDTATNTVVGDPIPIGTQAGFVVISPDGTRLYVADNADGTVSVINTATNTVLGDPIAVDRPYTLAVSPDGTRLYVANNADGTISVIDTATNTVVGDAIAVGNQPQGLAVSPDGTRLYVSTVKDDGDPSGKISGFVSVIDTGVTNQPGGGGTTGGGGSTGDGSDGGSGPVADFLSQVAAFTNGTFGSANINVTHLITQLSSFGTTGVSTVNALGQTSAQVSNAVIAQFLASLQSAFTGLANVVNGFHDAIFGSGAPRTSTPTRELYDNLREQTDGAQDGIRVGKITTDVNGVKRMVVYLGGTTPLDPNNQSVVTNLPSYTGDLKEKQTKQIEKALNGDKTVKIMLVGYSQGGMDAQNMAAKASFKDQVTTVVTFASPIVESANSYRSELDYVHIWDQDDIVPEFTFPAHQSEYNSVASHVFERQSNNDTALAYNTWKFVPEGNPFIPLTLIPHAAVFATQKASLHGDRSTYEQVSDTFDRTAGFTNVKTAIHNYLP